MSESNRIVRGVVMALCVGVTVAGLINVYGDNSEVVAKAQSVACGSPNCAVRVTGMERNPFTQSFTFQTKLEQQSNTNQQLTVDVRCVRAFFLVGEYSCSKKGAL